MIPALAWPAAVAVGLSLGLLGSGGSILTVPMLTAIVGLSQKSAVATSLPIVGFVAAFGALAHARKGAVDLRAAAPFVAASVSAAFLARRFLEPWVSGEAQRWAFAALMLLVAWRMAFARAPVEQAPARRPAAAVLGVGALVGALTGVLGVGGGFVIVPALVLMLRFDVRRAVGTSLVVIAVNCAASLVADRVGPGTPVRWDLAALFAGVGVAGALAGGRLAHRLPQRALRRTFAGVVVAMAGLLLWDPIG